MTSLHLGWLLGLAALSFAASCTTRTPVPVPVQPTISPFVTPASNSNGPQATLPPPQQTADAAADITAWLGDHALTFDTTDPTKGYTDLAALKPMVGDARIVALGEATHGTHEFFQMKHRLLEYLVDEMGFNSFAMEAGWPEANLVNDYIQTGQGDPKQLLATLPGIYRPWDTQEVLDLIQWMRAYNANPASGPRVSFYGFDMQTPWPAMDNVVEYLREVDPHASRWADGRYNCLRQFRNAGSKYAAASAAVRQQCCSALQSVYDWLVHHQTVYESKTSTADYNFTLQSARIPLQTEQFFAGPYDVAVRDQAMADNVTWLLQQAGPDAKMVLWAHNAHVQGFSANPPVSMGTHLKAAYGQQILTVGFMFYDGSFNAVRYSNLNDGWVSHQASVPPDNSYEHYFHLAGMPRMSLTCGESALGP